MKTRPECLSCFSSQITRTLAYADVKGDRKHEIHQKATSLLDTAAYDEIPARIATRVHRLLRDETGVDPYRQIKETYNNIAYKQLPAVRHLVDKAADRLEAGVRVAIAGNIIDFGIFESVDLDRSLADSFQLPLSQEEYQEFYRAVDKAQSILYLCDNAGEIVFDRVLLEELRNRGKKVTAVVKGAPVINDATLVDAAFAGLQECAEVIDNGSDGIGTLLEECSPRFIDRYRSADLIISKGQANFETLVKTGDNRIFFLFKVKCPVVADVLKREHGDIVLMGGEVLSELQNGTCGIGIAPEKTLG